MVSKVINLGANLKEIQIIPLGDFHIGDEFWDMEATLKTLEYIKNTPNCFTILNGDMMNNAIKTSKSDSYKEKMTIEQEQDFLVELLKPIKNKILYMVQGNHEYRTSITSGIDPLRYVAKALDLLDDGRYSDNSYVLNLRFGTNKNLKTLNNYIIYGIHGSGSGGKRMGATVNALEDLTKIFPNADLYIHSHTHVPITYSDKYVSFNTSNHKLEESYRTFVNTNSFINYGGYAERFGYKLTDQTPLLVTIKFIRKQDKLEPFTNVLKLEI